MQLLSINVSKKQLINYGTRQIETGIFKQPIHQAVEVFADHIQGDEQADLQNHGGLDKAVYAYSFAHYAYWQDKLGLKELDFGSFGENFTFSELDEANIQIGDIFKIGSCLLQVSQPRVPCFKLGLKFDNAEMPRLFTKSAKTGIYFRVLQTGIIAPDQQLEVVEQAKNSVSVQTLFNAYYNQEVEQGLPIIANAAGLDTLSEAWKGQLAKYLAKHA